MTCSICQTPTANTLFVQKKHVPICKLCAIAITRLVMLELTTEAEKDV